jgi:hypothetical protein
MSCIEESSLTQEVTTFGAAVLLDLGWNAFVAALYFCCLKARLDGAPALGAQFFAISGFLQLLATAALFVFCVPHCASCCPFHTQQWQYYGVSAIAGVIALLWLSCAWNRSRLAQVLASGELGTRSDSGIFSKVPLDAADGDVEMEMTENSDYSIGDDE